MAPLLSICCVLLSIVATLTAQDNDTDTDLGQVVCSHILFRHGERMPLEFYPNDPYKDSPNWPFQIAQLTDEGVQEEFELGRWLRGRYAPLVSPRYEPSEVFVQSTDVDRTLMSAQSCLAGFYSLADSEDPGLRWPSVPVHTVPVKDDKLLGAAATSPCPVYNTEVSRVLRMPEVKALQAKYKNLYDYVSNHTGCEVRSFDAALRIYDALAIEEKYFIGLPDWSLPIYPEPVREVGLYSFVLPTWTTLLKRLKIGPLLKEMAEHFIAKRDGALTPDRKLWFYSAHDATVAALLNSLDAFTIHFPPYASSVLLELRLINDKHFVTLFYRNNTTEEPQPLPILTCGSVCPLETFVSLVQPLLPRDWDQECELPAEKYFWITVAVVSVTAIILCVLLLILITDCLKKSSSGHYLTMSTPSLSTTNSKTSSGLADPSYALPK